MRYNRWICCIRIVVQLCPTLCDPMNWSTLGFSVHYYLPKFAQIHVHWVSDAIQPSHPLLSPSLAVSVSQDQGLFQWVNSLHQVAKVWASLTAQLVKNPPTMQETLVQVLNREDLLEKGKATHTSILGLPLWLAGKESFSGGYLNSMELQLQHQSFQWIFRVDFL